MSKTIINIPARDEIIRGFVIIPFIIFLIFIFPPLNISSVITAKKLYVGTIVAIKIDGIPMFSSPNKEIATGSPKSTKLLLKIP